MERSMEGIADREKIKSAIEALIFISNKPLMIEDLKKLFEDLPAHEIRALIAELKKEHEERRSGVQIVEIAGGFLMATSTEHTETIKSFYKIKHTEKLSGPSLETLAIIAYKQPVTRIDIETLRGVNADGVIRSLSEKNLIRIIGRKEVIGRPFVYGTTRQFLDYFGLKSLEELPKIEEFAQQDMAQDIMLASGEAEITPLSETEEEELRAAGDGFKEETKNEASANPS